MKGGPRERQAPAAIETTIGAVLTGGAQQHGGARAREAAELAAARLELAGELRHELERWSSENLSVRRRHVATELD